MMRAKRLLKFGFATILILVALSMGSYHTNAQELLISGGFEPGGGSEVPGWTLVESIFDQTTMMDRDPGALNTAQQQDFGPNQGDLALWLRPFVGEQEPSPDNLTNAILSQVVPVTAGQEYEFSGFSRYEFEFGGSSVTLKSTGPLGAVPSPNETMFKLEFLDSGGSVLGSPTTLDVTTSREAQAPFNDAYDDAWYQHVLTETAPTGAVNARVTAESRKMVDNRPGDQSLFFDTFSLTDTVAPSTNLLANADLEEEPPEFDPAWVITESPEGVNTLAPAGFANRPDSGGSQGVWLRAFAGSTEAPADAIISQTVEGSAGEDYTLTGWSRWEANYSGGDVSFGTETILELAFFDASDNEIDSAILDLFADGQVNGGGWLQHTLTATSPAGTVSVRASAAALGMVNNPLGGQQSAFFDDLSLSIGSGGLLADADGDMDVDGADFLMLQRTNPSLISAFQSEYGSGSSSVGSLAAVPEPSSLLSMALGMLASLSSCRRKGR